MKYFSVSSTGSANWKILEIRRLTGNHPLESRGKLLLRSRTCRDYPLSLSGRGVGLLLIRSNILGNEVFENRNGILYLQSKRQSTNGKEFDTYKVGTTANSRSTMHKMLAYPITLDCFEISDFTNLPYPVEMQREEIKSPCDTDFVQMCLIPYLEYLRQTALSCKDAGDEETMKIYWKELIRWLPNGWLQTRTVTMNYENLRTMYHQRKNHKLCEWSTDFINFVKSLPYSDEFIIN